MPRLILLSLLKFYQRYISPYKIRSCRFYPSCSEYAVWQFRKRNILIAFFATFFRILRCNPYNSGGFDYPLIKKNSFKLSPYKPSMKIEFFYVPYKQNEFYIVKNIFKGRQ
ncbi:putative membrane protein insertion efficiency factor, YidD family [Campylobacter avium LMG 24591]|uniref:Putative membrane protein insertion efficiency factor n=1 Tax=Campylobacter avium LMG 24591 TaxID=522484 RepID=A0A222MWV7_9BACT|nr:membrane protein insertion efficiency factor YidD [Campylobacter avium]ASQ30564.1 putative membrane protein insertion efficiency factor, YidD family [Campylobacter avium LMG 24591]HJE65782.1 membrane protein insertion efficiency factor YidD [Campylobacter avium]